MATVQQPSERYVEFDEYIDFQLDKARNGIKWTDILAAAAGVAALVIGYLVVFVAADHWLFDGGVPRPLRLTALFVVAAVAVGWLGWKVLWPYVRRVNDLYAARMLEEAEPSLRGSLFGLVDLRRAGRPPAEEVRRALEKRAATTLSSIDVDAALDRRPLMRTSYVLLGVVLVACAYAVLSPKRVGPSIVRALFPTSATGVATRTEILAVTPGDASVLAGTQLDVSVMIRGETPERVLLFYSTHDRRFVDEPVELRLHDETTREYRATLVGDAGRGLTQDLTYRVEANDDSAGPFAVAVEQPPAATVASVTLQYPPYTGLEPSVRDTPPIDAIEGTNATLAATANRRLKSAKLVFADDERFLARGEEVPMRVGEDGVTLTASWKLAIRSDGTSPTFYRIECRDEEGKTNPNPAVYPIAIRPDQPPEVTLHDPKSDLERPANAVIPLLVTARDPDFRLRELTLRLEKRGQELPERTVLWEGSQPEAAVRFDWNLAPLGLKPGDVVSFYVQARDNREPEFNRRNTPKLNVTITEPVAKEEVERRLSEDRQRQDEELAEAERNEAAPDRPQQPEGDDAAPAAGESAERDGEPGEGRDEQATEPGEAGRAGESPQPSEAGDRQADSGERSGSRVNNDGSADDEVLRKLLERQREKQEQPPKQDDQRQGEERQNEEAAQQGQGDRSEPQQGGSKADGRQGEQGQKGQKPQEGTEGGQGEQAGEAGGDQPSAGNEGAGRSQRRDGAGDRPREGGDRDGTRDGSSPPVGEASDPTGSGREAGSESPRREEAGDQGGQPGSAKAQGGDRERAADGRRDGSASDPNGRAGERSQPAGEQPRDQGDQTDAPAGETGRPAERNENAAGAEGSRPQPGDATQGGRPEPGDTAQNASDGGLTGTPPQTDDRGAPSESPAADGQRTPSEPGRPQPNGREPGAAEPNPGEGRPDQRSQRPDSGERGTGQPNADGTPDGQTGPGDAGTQPGSQQPSERPTGQTGAPGEGQSRRPNAGGGQGGQDSRSAAQGGQKGQNQPGQPNEQGGRQGESGERNEQSGEQGGGRGEQQNGRSGQGQEGQKNGQSGQGGQQGGSGQGQSGDKGQSGQDGQRGQGGSGDQQSQSGDGGERGGPEAGDEGGGQQGGQDGGQQSGQGGEQSGQGGEQSGQGGEQGGQGGEQGGQGGQQGGQAGQGGQQGGQGGQSGQGGQPGQGGEASGTGGTQSGGGGGGRSGDASGGANGAGDGGATAAGPDEANAEYAKQATDLALKKLENDLRRGEVDRELLEELGWTEEDMRRFADRLRKNLSEPTGDETPQDLARRREFEHMLENLRLGEGPGARQGGNERVKDVDVGTSNPQVPSEYRDAFERFTRSVAGRRQAEGKK